jgi:hypothetical protein
VRFRELWSVLEVDLLISCFMLHVSSCVCFIFVVKKTKSAPLAPGVSNLLNITKNLQFNLQDSTLREVHSEQRAQENRKSPVTRHRRLCIIFHILQPQTN